MEYLNCAGLALKTQTLVDRLQETGTSNVLALTETKLAPGVRPPLTEAQTQAVGFLGEPARVSAEGGCSGGVGILYDKTTVVASSVALPPHTPVRQGCVGAAAGSGSARHTAGGGVPTAVDESG